MNPSQRQRLKYIISDLLASNVAWLIFNLVRYFTLPYNYEQMGLWNYITMTNVVIGQILFPLMMVGLYALSGFYNEMVGKSRVDEVINTYGMALLGAFAIFFIALFNDNIEDRLRNYEMVLLLWILIGTLTYIPRMLLTRRFTRLIVSGKVSFNTLIVGLSERAKNLAEGLEQRYPNLGFKIVGFMSAKEGETIDKIGHHPVIKIEEAEEAIRRMDVKRLIVVHRTDDPHRMVDVINKFFPTGVSIYITPDTMHYITMRPRTQSVSGEVLIDVTKSHVRASTLNMKRIADIVLSSITLVLLSPVMGVIALMVKKSSPGPIIYKQERIGYHKKPFNILKFRSMYVDSEKNGPALSSDNDDRVTPLGKILRKYRLDELPQFVNVLKGDMSIVGPRPERDYYLQQIIKKAPYYSLLQQVRPGITSWGMVKYGYANTVDQMIERAQYDLLYIDNLSMIVDLKILLYTIETVVTGRGV